MASDSFIKKVGYFAVFWGFVLIVILLASVLLRGMVWASEKALPWLLGAGRIAFDVCVLILGPLCIFKKTRPWAGLGYFFSSYLFGTILFAISCIATVQLWGYGALFIGLILAGVGVVPVALLAAVFHGEWMLFWFLLFGVVLTFGTRYLGLRLTGQHEPTEESVYVG